MFGAGIFYGLYHQAKLSSAAKLAAIDREYEHKQKLIEQAKAAYTKKNLPASAKTESGGRTFQALSCLLSELLDKSGISIMYHQCGKHRTTGFDHG